MQADTARLRIESLRREHAALLFTALADRRAYAYIPERPPKSSYALALRYAQVERGAPRGSGERWLNWAVRLKTRRTYVGTLQATIDRRRTASIGYVIAPRHWHRGYATEGCTWLLNYLSTELRIVAFHASVDARNLASWRLLEALQFTRVGTRTVELHGQRATDFMYRRVHALRPDLSLDPDALPAALARRPLGAG
jgi:RimJ/RimL family protein N-acetyltransferase